mgnify:CR=1 FL=1
MNIQNENKISWCNVTINPVIGCKNRCPYCYARKINDRFHFVPDFTKPVFFPERLKQFNSKKPKSIFINSMSDIEYWTGEQMKSTISAIKANKHHKYIFLTKADCAPYDLFFYHSFHQKNEEKSSLNIKTADAAEGQHVFLGKTITGQADITFTDYYNFDFLSIEPIHEAITLGNTRKGSNLKQVIIGAETGNRKGKVIPKKEWIDDIVRQADEYGIRVFMKESLKSIMGTDFRQDKLIWSVE